MGAPAMKLDRVLVTLTLALAVLAGARGYELRVEVLRSLGGTSRPDPARFRSDGRGDLGILHRIGIERTGRPL